MPYAGPASPAVPFPSQGRAGHRRSYSHITPPESFASTSTTGAFASLGALPRRRSASATLPTTPAPTTAPYSTPPKKQKPTFQLGRDDDDEDSPDESNDPPRTKSYDDDDDFHRNLPPLRLKTKMLSSFEAPRASPPPSQIHLSASVPFPRSSPLTSPLASNPPPLPRTTTTSEPKQPENPPPRPIRPSVIRTASSPILLSNGKPLKSSLKSSSSSPNIPFPPQSLVPSIMFPHLHQPQPTHHQRARSAPSTPHLSAISDPHTGVPSSPPGSSTGSSTPLLSPSPPPSPPQQKNVHFPSQEEGGLATVRLFNRSAKPASLSRIGDETETETEGEGSSAPAWGSVGSKGWTGGYVRGSAYPFPMFPGSSKSPLGVEEKQDIRYEIDMANSSPVPARGAERAEGNVYFESLGFLCEVGTEKPTKPLTLTGTVLVRNVAYQKTVAVRFTLDDWHTTNDVLARHEKSLGGLPERFLLASLPTSNDDSSNDCSKREVVCKPFGFQDVIEGVSSPSSIPAWDRFRFEISLENYESTLENRTMWFVGRYAAGAMGSSLGVGANGELSGTNGGDYSEWWDNNSGGNYRVGFVKKVVVDRRQVEPSMMQAPPLSAVQNSSAAGYRRAVVLSAPPSFSPTKPFPAPPQISSSVSYPASGMTPQQRLQAQQHQAALTQSTLSRLKKLNLRNYAVPAGAAKPPGPTTRPSEQENHARAISTSSINSIATNASTDSTPIQTPTQEVDEVYRHHAGGGEKHDVDVDVLPHDSPTREGEVDDQLTPTLMGRPRWGLSSTSNPATNGRGYGGLEGMPGLGMGMQNGFPATISPVPVPASSKPISISGAVEMDRERDVLSPLPLEMGTSPPFSALAGLGMKSTSSSPPRGGGMYWPWSSFGGEKKGEEKEKENVPASQPAAVVPLTAPVASLLSDIKEKNTATPPPTGVGLGSGPSVAPSGPIMPPQRRRATGRHPEGHAPGHKATFSVGTGSNSNSSSSGSGSGSETGKHGAVTPRAKRGSPTPTPAGQQPWAKPPLINTTAPTSSSSQGHHQRSSTPPYPGSPKRFFASIPRTASPVPMSPLRMSPVNSSSHLVNEKEKEKPQDDAVYQAFVRQWCFAQGPGPAAAPTAVGEKRGAGAVVS